MAIFPARQSGFAFGKAVRRIEKDFLHLAEAAERSFSIQNALSPMHPFALPNEGA